eukprot:3927686-Rhodomonas_salina.5
MLGTSGTAERSRERVITTSALLPRRISRRLCQGRTQCCWLVPACSSAYALPRRPYLSLLSPMCWCWRLLLPMSVTRSTIPVSFYAIAYALPAVLRPVLPTRLLGAVWELELPWYAAPLSAYAVPGTDIGYATTGVPMARAMP